MCDYCHKHGEGKKWYLQAKNYSDDLLSDLKRRKFVEEFFGNPSSLVGDFEQMKKFDTMPAFMRRIISGMVTRKMKKIHFGQVVPLEDVERIFEFTNSLVRVACLCRHLKYSKEQRFCYGISLNPNGGEIANIMKSVENSYVHSPNYTGVEEVTKEETLANFQTYERQGLCHTVWTFHEPFIGGICNCDKSDCMAMVATVTYETPVMFRAEYVGTVDWDKCNGCRKCMLVCQYGAFEISVANKKVNIDPRRCFGCGICRSVCTPNAIALLSRSQVPIAASLW